MTTLFTRLAAALTAASPALALALAHPGHGVVDGWAHWFTPEHVLPGLVAVGLLVYLLARGKGRE